MFGSHPKRKRTPVDSSLQSAPSRHRRATAPRATEGECTRCDYAAWILAVLGTIFVLVCHLLPGVIAGLLVYELVHVLFPVFARRLPDKRAKFAAVALIALLVVGAITAAALGIIGFMRSEGGSVAALLAKMAEILDGSRAALPPSFAEYLPSDAGEMRETMTRWLREHALDVQQVGRRTGVMLIHVVVGMAIGAMIAMREAFDHDAGGPLTRALAERLYRMGEAFRRVVFAQMKISAINTIFTAIYLTVVLPLLGIHLPLTKTMIAVTFIAGLLPVIGNLISNTMIVVVSLAHSPVVAASSLAYLIVIHKLEYFLNARIVGVQISAKAWELLIAMLLMESIFGLAGLVAAPICYAWLKDELATRKLI